MLKRSIAVMLMLLYISTVSGFALNLHYCFSRLSSVGIDVAAKKCDNSIETGKMQCCKVLHLKIKLKDAHQSEATLQQAKLFDADLPVFYLPYTYFENKQATLQETYSDPPLKLRQVPVFLTNCTFRI
ncbi:MAG TPA: hypothetical protein VHC47_01730 [Mucilaginibacter sp.]|nr:hypothetical protein [Mucilaginibacter sp.]